MENKYLTAQEARKLADEFNKFNVEGLKNVLEDIKSLSSRGETELNTPYVYGLYEALTELGYDVERYGKWGEEYLEIKW